MQFEKVSKEKKKVNCNAKITCKINAAYNMIMIFAPLLLLFLAV